MTHDVVEEVYTIHTRFGMAHVAVPFICQKCGRCCRKVSVHGFGRPCRYLDLKTNLCTIYSKRPDQKADEQHTT